MRHGFGGYSLVSGKHAILIVYEQPSYKLILPVYKEMPGPGMVLQKRVIRPLRGRQKKAGRAARFS